MKILKSILAIVIAAMTFGACSNDDDLRVKHPTMKLYRSKSEAIEIAKDAYASFYGIENRSAAKVETAEVHSIQSHNSRSTSEPLLYVVNFEDSLGFALIATSTAIDPIVGIAEKGNYDPKNPDENENFNFFMDYAIAYADTLPSIGNGTGTVPPGSWGQGGIMPPAPATSVEPKVSMLWGQNAPYGDFFPNNVAGCANTAVALIMSYFRQPQTLYLTYLESATPVWVDLDWDLMCQHIHSSTAGCTEDDLHTAHYQLRSMFRQIGYENLSYPSPSNPNATSTRESDLLRFLRNHGYTCNNLEDFSVVDYKSFLRGNYIVGVAGISQTGTGHIWIMDGFKTIIGRTYCHYNWGWDGRNNGYFAANVFDTQNAYSFDGNSNPANYNFSYSIRLFPVTYNNQ